EPGICRVVCFSPRHDLALSRMDCTAIRAVVDTWVGEFQRLGARDEINYVLIFENRGAAMGASNPHPHGQIWATAGLPNEPAREQASLAAYSQAHRVCLLCQYASIESARGERIVFETDTFTVIVPFWAVWPFETLVIAKRHVTGLHGLDERERNDLAELL